MKYLFAGIATKILASFDDTITRIPVIAQVTYTRKGKVAFCFGNLLAVTAAIVLARLFSEALEQFPYTRALTAVLIVLLALAVYFDILGKKEAEKVEKHRQKIKHIVNYARFWKLTWIGFVVSAVTLLDDFVVLTPLFLGSVREQIWAVAGVYLATFAQFYVMIYLANRIARWKYTKEIASAGLLLLAVVVYFKLI